MRIQTDAQALAMTNLEPTGFLLNQTPTKLVFMMQQDFLFPIVASELIKRASISRISSRLNKRTG
jgi:hypothetical protein